MRKKLEHEILADGQKKENFGLMLTRPRRRDNKIGKRYKKYSPGRQQKP